MAAPLYPHWVTAGGASTPSRFYHCLWQNIGGAIQTPHVLYSQNGEVDQRRDKAASNRPCVRGLWFGWELEIFPLLFVLLHLIFIAFCIRFPMMCCWWYFGSCPIRCLGCLRAAFHSGSHASCATCWWPDTPDWSVCLLQVLKIDNIRRWLPGQKPRFPVVCNCVPPPRLTFKQVHYITMVTSALDIITVCPGYRNGLTPYRLTSSFSGLCVQRVKASWKVAIFITCPAHCTVNPLCCVTKPEKHERKERKDHGHVFCFIHS